MKLIVAVIGAGSWSFGPASVRDLLLSEPLAGVDLEVRLMDVAAERLEPVRSYAEAIRARLSRACVVRATTSLAEAVAGAHAAICAVEARRWHYWAMDFHLPRIHGFRQPYGENGGVGGIFHALRNIPPMLEIARALADAGAPGALLLNYTNPEHKLCEAITRLTRTPVVGLCHGIGMGRRQVSQLTGVPDEHLQVTASGINHFTFLQDIRDARTGEDLMPRLREADARGHELAQWHELALGRVLFRRFGLWPSPAANHYGEYIRWADAFVLSDIQYYHDPAKGAPWETGKVPEFVYELRDSHTHRPWEEPARPAARLEDQELKESGEFGVPILEGLHCGVARRIDAVNVPNHGAIPNLPDESVVEVPAEVDREGLRPLRVPPLPEGIAAMIRTHLSIHQLIVEAVAESSKDKLLQAVLLEPTVDSYARAVAMVDRFLELQAEVLPPLR